jgi:hypothetical protein
MFHCQLLGPTEKEKLAGKKVKRVKGEPGKKRRLVFAPFPFYPLTHSAFPPCS